MAESPPRRIWRHGSLLAFFLAGLARAGVAGPGVEVEQSGGRVRVSWPISSEETGSAVFALDEGRPLIESLGVAAAGRPVETIATGLDPVTLLTVGNRDLANPAGWVAFFDNPHTRPHATFPVALGKRRALVTTRGARTTVSLAEASAGSFRGDVRFTFTRNSPLIHAETVLATHEDGRAIVYDAGLAGASPGWRSIAWRDAAGTFRKAPYDPASPATPLAVSGRAIVAEGPGGSLAAFPAPHQYFYPQDEAFNLQFAWHGRGLGGLVGEPGIGIRQSLVGDRRYSPWFNAPPGTEQHLGVFYLLARGDAGRALDAVARYTRGDRFKKLPGHLTFTSHYHVEHTLELLRKRQEQGTEGVPRGLEMPGMVRTFKARGVDIIHLAEFHNGRTPKLPAEERLRQLKTLHDECGRLSDEELLLLPGEEPNVHLGGHWVSLFPKPVLWVLNRPEGRPFAEMVEGLGTVYHVGSSADVLRLMEQEGGLMWTAHPRIKGSIGFPDKYQDQDFFRSDRFLGAAWKAMPADLSRPTLGWRSLDLLDDMANWGAKKQVLGEADLFRMEPDFETYAHMNVNYLKLNRLPLFQDGWRPVLDALRGGRFFTSTGEVLIPSFRVGGKESGQALDSPGATTLEADLEWTFPMAFAEVISGDGQRVFRQRVDLADSEDFGTRTLRIPVDLNGRKWVRLEAWDIAANGAFTQPVWLAAEAPPADREPATWARFVPERKDDFAWENDLVAFRAYGPAIRAAGKPFKPGDEDSGIDCWNKRVPYPIVDRWYAGEQKGISYHEDHGEGNDLYKVGSSRGCGGTAIWKDGRMILSGPFRSWRLISRGRERSVFELDYEYDVDGAKVVEVKRITIELGRRLFRSESTFTQGGRPARLDVAVGVTTHDGRAKATLDPARGWMSCWEAIEGHGLGTGVVIDPARVAEMREDRTPGGTEGHALLVTRTDDAGKVVHFAGFGWAKAGQITSPERWHDHLATFAASLKDRAE